MILLITHITIAITSLLTAGAGIVRPSQKIQQASYGLIAATIVSGTALVIVTNSPILSSCVTGLAYTAVATTLTVFGRRRLAAETER